MPAKTMRDTIERKTINTTVLRDGILKGNEDVIDKHTAELLKVLSVHVSEISALMATPGPEKRISFTKINEMNFIDASGVSVESINDAIGNCKLISKSFITYSNPFYILISSLVSYHLRKKTLTANKNEVGRLLSLYLALRIYKAAFGAFFPNYIPNPDVMSATIENLNSNRFNVKKYKTIFNTIVYISDSHYENFNDILNNPIDDNILYYISNLYGRIKQMMRLISNMYYDNHMKGIRQGTDSLYSEGEDGEEYLNEVENVSSLITVNSRKIYHSFISDSVPDVKILKNICDEVTKVSYSKMTITLSKIIEAKEPLIEDIIVKMLSYFYTNGGETIKSSKFINMMVEVYSVSNSANETILEIKKLLDDVMNKYSVEFLKSSHVGQKSLFKKTVFLYLVLFSVSIM